MNLWSRKQLDRLAQDREFICMDLGRDLYQVGKYYLERQQEHSWVVKNRFHDKLYDFYNRQAAVLYCLFDSRNQIHKAIDFKKGHKDLLHFYIHQVGSDDGNEEKSIDDVVRQVMEIVNTCENTNLKALQKFQKGKYDI